MPQKNFTYVYTSGINQDEEKVFPTCDFQTYTLSKLSDSTGRLNYIYGGRKAVVMLNSINISLFKNNEHKIYRDKNIPVCLYCRLPNNFFSVHSQFLNQVIYTESTKFCRTVDQTEM